MTTGNRVTGLMEALGEAVSDYQALKENELHRWQAKVHVLEQQMVKESVAAPGLERVVRVSPAWDRRSPNSAKNYGWHGMELHWVLRGPKGAVEWTVGTNWVVQAMIPELQSWDVRRDRWGQSERQILVAHAYVQQPERPRLLHEGACEYLGVNWCYLTELRTFGEGEVQAHALYWILVEQGDAAFWTAMQTYYDALVGPDDGEGDPQ